MATFIDIHGRALRQILFYAIKDISLLYSPTEELRKFFSPAWVCREWRRVLLPRLYNYSFLIIISPTSASEHSKVVSNIRLTVENGLSKYTQRLFISLPDGYIASGHLIELLDMELFNKTRWPSIYDLDISENPPSVSTNSRQNENSTDMGDTISQYFHMHLPSLTSISVSLEEDTNTTTPLSKFINLKLHQLSTLAMVRAPVIFTCHSFYEWLTVLILRLTPGQTTLPYIYTPNLRRLWLLDIPPNFSWKYFHSENSDSFDFSELKVIGLHYSTTSVDLKSATSGRSGAYPHSSTLRKFHLPKIKHLSLSHIPPSDAHLFAPHLQSHLDSLDIVGSIDVLTQLGLRFPFSKEMSIRLSDNTVDDIQGYSTLTETIFSSFSVATWVTFEVEHYIPVSINSVGWSNLNLLNISAFISRITLYRVLSQLPLLEELRVRYITSDNELYHYDKQHGISPYFPDGPNFSSELRHLEYFKGTSRFPLVFDLGPLYELITNVVTLKEVSVPEYYLQEIQDHFSQVNIQDYPHVHEIHFTDSCEVFQSPGQ